jgi:CubicO group peptidase (beta-lactamase class C family)
MAGTSRRIRSSTCLARNVIEPPGSRWNGGLSADSYLLRPLGITWRHWEIDNRGIPNGGAGLDLRPRDMAKIGQLVLQQGRSADAFVVPGLELVVVTTATWEGLGTGAGPQMAAIAT